MYHVSAQGVDERMINVHYYYYFVFGARVGHFAATPQSDVIGIHHRSQRALTGIVSKITPNLGLVL